MINLGNWLQEKNWNDLHFQSSKFPLFEVKECAAIYQLLLTEIISSEICIINGKLNKLVPQLDDN